MSNKFNDKFLNEICLYIDDYRLLKNIYNEFVIYLEELNNKSDDIKININKLFAMITYKNIFPQDFSKLQSNTGYIKFLFDSKESFKDKRKKELEEKIEDLKMDSGELRHYGGYEEIDPDEIEDKIMELEKELDELDRYNLKELINRENKLSFFKSIEDSKEDYFKTIISDNYFDLIVYLVSNGYIDENSYYDYTSYFYEGSLSLNDRQFLRSLSDQAKLKYHHSLNNLEIVYNSIHDKYYSEPEILNIDLVNYLLENEEDFDKEDKLNTLRGTIYRNIDFIESYIYYVKNKRKFCETFLGGNRTIGKVIESELREEVVLKILLLSIYYNRYEFSPKLYKYICENDALLNKSNIEYLDIEKDKEEVAINGIIEKFKSSNILFEDISFEEKDSISAYAIYKNDLYTFSFENLKSVLNHFYTISKKQDSKINDDFNNKLITLIFSNKEAYLYKYVVSSINKFMEEYFKFNSESYDKEEVVLEILNNEELSLEYKRKYLTLLRTKIKNITDINVRELWDNLIENKLLDDNLINIVSYYGEKQCINSSLVKYINDLKIPFKLDFDSIEYEKGKDFGYKFFLNLCLCNEIENDNYSNFLNDCCHKIRELCIEEINEDKIEILINTSSIEVNEYNLTQLRKVYPGKVMKFIEISLSEINEDLLNNEELKDILSNTEVSDTDKIRLMNLTNKKISYSDDFSHAVKRCILKNHLIIDEIGSILKEYNDIYMKEAIVEMLIKNIEFIIKSNIEIKYELLYKLLSSKISDTYKLQLIDNNFDLIRERDLQKCFKTVTEENFSDLFIGKRPLIKKIL